MNGARCGTKGCGLCRNFILNLICFEEQTESEIKCWKIICDCCSFAVLPHVASLKFIRKAFVNSMGMSIWHFYCLPADREMATNDFFHST